MVSLVLALLGLALLCSPAGAKDDKEEKLAVPMEDRWGEAAPDPESGPFPTYSVLLAVLGVAGVSAIAFKNSKRTHLD